MPSQYRAFWSIPNAGPAVTTFHAQATLSGDAQQFADRVRGLFLALQGRIPDEVAVTFDSEVTYINTATGVLESATAVTPPAIVAGGYAGGWASGSGGRIVWGTGEIRNGRRVRGTTFIVPLGGAEYAPSGRLTGGTVAALQAAADAYLSGMGADGNPVYVYSRPIPGRAGATSEVTVATVPETVATLRSRKY